MGRRLRQLLILLCLILAIATAGLWVRSYWRGDDVGHRRQIRTAADGSARSDRSVGVLSVRGRVKLFVYRMDFSGFRPGDLTNHSPFNGWAYVSGPPDDWARVEGALGFGVKSRSNTFSISGDTSNIVTITETTLQFPHWFLVLLLSIPPAITAVRWWRRRRVRREMGAGAVPCPACGYDCRATPDGCPECGRRLRVACNG